jgi:hypothetical protein
MACAAVVVGGLPYERRHGANCHRCPLQRVASGQNRLKTSANNRREEDRTPFAAFFAYLERLKTK